MTDDQPQKHPLTALFESLGAPSEVKKGPNGEFLGASWPAGSLQAMQDQIQTDMMAKVEFSQHPDKESRLQVNDSHQPVCIGCGHSPEELDEYIYQAKMEETTPTWYVIEDEGTYNPKNGHFTCDPCYIAMGQPSGPRGWKAP